MLQIYNSLSRKKEPLRPLIPNQVRMYVCGMTVYDYCHLGHARVLVVFDLVYRYLQNLGLEVTYVRNITDIDDKIIARAAEQGVAFTELTERFIAAMHEDAAALGVLPPTIEPRATAHITEIIALIERLIAHDHAYVAANGDVYYAVASFAGVDRVFVIEADRAVARAVTLGRRGDAWVEVVDGLDADDAVIRRPGAIQSGHSVRIVEDDPAATSDGPATESAARSAAADTAD